MRILWGTLFIWLISFSVMAQSSNGILVGPVSYQQNINGILINITAKSYLLAETSGNNIRLKIRVIGDLFDLQRKIGQVVDTFPLPKENCAHYSANNPVVSLPTKELSFKEGSAIFRLGGSVTVWQCLENPVPNSKVVWEIHNVGLGIKTKVPVVKAWPGNPIKTIIVTQPFDVTLPVSLIKVDDRTIGLRLSRPDIELKGQYAFIKKGATEHRRGRPQYKGTRCPKERH